MKLRGAAVALGIGLVLALATLAIGYAYTPTLDEERLRLDKSLANLASADGSGGYLVLFPALEAGDRVHVAFSLRREGTVSVREASAFDGPRAPPPDDGSALAVNATHTGNLTFVAPAAGDYALAIESPGAEPVGGVVLLTYDPPQEARRNPVIFGVARTIGVLTALVTLVVLAFENRKASSSRR